MEKNHAMEEPHIVLLPSTGMGHLRPLIEFSKCLLSHRSLNITFLIVSGQFPASAISKLGEHPNINTIALPPVDTSDLPTDTEAETIISVVIQRSIEPLRKLLPEIRPISAFVFDFFCTDALDAVAELKLPAYILFTSTATLLSLMLYLPILHEQIPGEYCNLKEPIQAPGCLPFRGTELVNPLLDRQNVNYWWFLRHARRLREGAGILLNSFDELEPRAIEALLQGRDYQGSIPPVYPIGPLVKSVDEGGEEECIKWLDEQPQGSVLFVCFGSGGTLTQEQLVELAWGLEMSRQRFLWVVRRPRSCPSAAFFGSGARKENEDPLSFLPQGFIQRTAELGLVVPNWAPQMMVLRHEAVGGFLSHCGWNSTLECIVCGVPMIGWPLYAEQRMNARMLAEEMRIAVVVKNEGRVVPREEVRSAVSLLMEGEERKKLRKRVSELRGTAAEALGEMGSSFRRLDQLVHEWAKLLQVG